MVEQQKTQQIQVRYSETSSLFTSQFLVNATAEDLTIGFSSGYIQDPASRETVLPIHSRISMTKQGAKRLYETLGKILSENATAPVKQDKSQPNTTGSSPARK